MSSSMANPPATAHGAALGPRAWWQRLAPRHRRILRALFALALVLVLVVGALLARFLSVENAERDDDVALVRAEARGDAAGMLEQLSGCRASAKCVAQVKADASNPHVRRSGAVKILQLESKTIHSRSGATSRARVAWTVIGTPSVVQCVEVRRTGNFLSGIDVQLLGLSAPISGEGKCWKSSRIEQEEEEATAVEEGR
jgi:hypothetical protein